MSSARSRESPAQSHGDGAGFPWEQASGRMEHGAGAHGAVLWPWVKGQVTKERILSKGRFGTGSNRALVRSILPGCQRQFTTTLLPSCHGGGTCFPVPSQCAKSPEAVPL